MQMRWKYYANEMYLLYEFPAGTVRRLNGSWTNIICSGPNQSWTNPEPWPNGGWSNLTDSFSHRLVMVLTDSFGHRLVMVPIRTYASIHILVQQNRSWIKKACMVVAQWAAGCCRFTRDIWKWHANILIGFTQTLHSYWCSMQPSFISSRFK